MEAGSSSAPAASLIEPAGSIAEHVYDTPDASTPPTANTCTGAFRGYDDSHTVWRSHTPAGGVVLAAKGLTAADRVAGSVDDVARSAASPYSSASGGLSRAGQSLSKRQHRGGPLPQASGSPAAISRQAQDIVEEVLTSPASTFNTRQTGRFGEVVDVQIPGGPGVRYSERDGFLHFLEQ